MRLKSTRISNRERSQATVAALVSAARRQFVKQGYANTGTPDIVAAAKVTRGALYHHFDNKADLFLAVARQAAGEVSREIARQTRGQKSPLAAMTRGAEAYFAAMAERGRARLLLLEAPSILTHDQLQELSDLAGSSELRTGLENTLGIEARNEAPIEALTTLLSAAFDRAALAVVNGESATQYKLALNWLLSGLAETG